MLNASAWSTTTTDEEDDMPIAVESPRSSPARTLGPNSMLALATVGFLVNFWAWALLSPLGARFSDQLALSPFQQALLVAVPVVVGSVGRIPVGALTDRYGGRIMFPAVSFATIVPVLFLGLLGHTRSRRCSSAGSSSGSAGRPSPSGSLRQRVVPAGRRGFAIGVFGAGMGGTAISALTTVKLVKARSDRRTVPARRGRSGGCTAVVAALLAARRPRARSSRDRPSGRRAGTLRLSVDLAGVRALRGRLRRLRRLLGVPADVPQDRVRARPRRTRRTRWPASWSSR